MLPHQCNIHNKDSYDFGPDLLFWPFGRRSGSAGVCRPPYRLKLQDGTNSPNMVLSGSACCGTVITVPYMVREKHAALSIQRSELFNKSFTLFDRKRI